ncbi:retrovirus-related Pol polyprotein from transposon opus [Trichonephila clavata]|uniref:Retrovirus-related Pol polyprotein from transposon opus n=1 Tax=Trichonephila clavata TaxID=2740835 RepID=A0A8X6FLR4_TRICU|nr:retrovirus-related Pol polyprotein from transposon opus [Trichonephila clavata]
MWSVDCIGPLDPRLRRGHKNIVSAIDLCSRWADAIPTKSITAKTTCEVLMRIFIQTGCPTTICTDQGTNFTTQLTQAFQDVLGVSPRFSTPGHPESMGAVECWNRTLKDMLNKNIQEHGNEWDVHLPYLLFAYREIPHALTGVSPYQLVYGRLPSGLMTILKEFWTGEREIPTSAARPAKGVKLTRPHSCLVQTEDGSTRELHVNKLRPYISRVDHVGIIFDQDTDFGELHYAPTDKETQPKIDIELNQMPDVLNAHQKYQLRNLLQRYEDIFRNHPGKAKVKSHSVKVTADSSPKRLQPYRVPIALQKEVECQINELLE